MVENLSLRRVPAEAEALRAPVRAFLDEALAAMPPELRARAWLGFDADFSRRLGEKGWIGLALPPQYGGGGRDWFARFVLVEELLARGAPVSAHWIAERQSAPLILAYGTEEQKRFHLPRICRGESFFAIGMNDRTPPIDHPLLDLHRTGSCSVESELQRRQVVAPTHLLWQLEHAAEHRGHQLRVRDSVPLDQGQELLRVEALHDRHGASAADGQRRIAQGRRVVQRGRREISHALAALP